MEYSQAEQHLTNGAQLENVFNQATPEQRTVIFRHLAKCMEAMVDDSTRQEAAHTIFVQINHIQSELIENVMGV